MALKRGLLSTFCLRWHIMFNPKESSRTRADDDDDDDDEGEANGSEITYEGLQQIDESQCCASEC